MEPRPMVISADHRESLKNSSVEEWNNWRSQSDEVPNLASADLSNLGRLHGINLSKANLQYSVLSGSDLTDADLHGADLTKATLNKVVLKGADLTRSIFRNAKLPGSDLQDAIL